jgi:hypothetical protein
VSDGRWPSDVGVRVVDGAAGWDPAKVRIRDFRGSRRGGANPPGIRSPASVLGGAGALSFELGMLGSRLFESGLMVICSFKQAGATEREIPLRLARTAGRIRRNRG